MWVYIYSTLKFISQGTSGQEPVIAGYGYSLIPLCNYHKVLCKASLGKKNFLVQSIY